MKKITIVDLEKNHKKIVKKNENIIYLNCGEISDIDCKIILLKNLEDTNILRKKFSYCISNYLNKINFSFFNEIEFFNLRNDKELKISKFFNTIKIINLIKKKKLKQIELISDDQSTVDLFKKLNVNINLQVVERQKIKYINIFFYITKFYLKTLIVSILAKLFSNKNKILRDECAFTFYPNFYQKRKENFYKNNKLNLINFLLADETILNLSLLEIFKIIRNSNLRNIEEYISISKLPKYYFISLKKSLMSKAIASKMPKVFGNELYSYFRNYINASILNRAKLEIYNDVFIKLDHDYNFKKYHFYLFEYHFGFYLMNKLKETKKEIIGYQHGIFSENLMWLDIYKNLKNKNFPDLIVSNNLESQKYYKKVYHSTKTSYQKKSISVFSKKIHLKSTDKNKKILIISGTHDIKYLYYYFKKKSYKNSNQIYYLKVHPKNKFKFKSTQNLIKLLNFKSIYFNEIYISKTSTIAYDFDRLKKTYKSCLIDYYMI